MPGTTDTNDSNEPSPSLKVALPPPPVTAKFPLQLGATYRITDYLSAFAGVRMNYVSNGYEGHIRNIEANIGGGEMVNVNKYFSDYAKQARTAADAYLLQMIWLIMQNMMPLQKKQPRLPD